MSSTLVLVLMEEVVAIVVDAVVGLGDSGSIVSTCNGCRLQRSMMQPLQSHQPLHYCLGGGWLPTKPAVDAPAAAAAVASAAAAAGGSVAVSVVPSCATSAGCPTATATVDAAHSAPFAASAAIRQPPAVA